MEYDVVIVGYGPVGAVLANLLARYNLRVAIVERAAAVYDKPRAITFDHEALRVFQAIGLSEFMDGTIVPHNGTHYLGVDGDVIKMFDPMPPPYPLGWLPNAMFIQPEVEQALREALSKYAQADVFLQAAAQSVQQDENSASVSVRSELVGDVVLRARYLVACDGANSLVRKQLDIGLEDLAFDEWWMVVDALTSDLAKRPSKSFQYCWPSRPGTFVPGPRNLRRWEIKLLPGEDPQEAGQPDNVLRLLKGFTDTSDLTIWRSAVYRFHALLAHRWRDRRIFLMGDAVHQTPPFLGQGLCAGVRDAANLAWKLAVVLRGNAEDALLDSYEVERKPHVRAVVASAKEFGKIIGELDPDAAAARDVRLRAELKSGQAVTIRQKFIPDLEGGLIARNARLAGGLFVQPWVETQGGGTCRLDDMLKPEFAIVSRSLEALSGLSRERLASWRKLGGELVVISSPDEVSTTQDGCSDDILRLVETEQIFENWMRDNEIEAVVVRPDRYVFGGAEMTAQLDGLIAEVVDRLSGEAGRTSQLNSD